MYDVIIVGGGIAAMSAAIFTSRRGLKTLVLGKDVGGQANYTDLIENYPGVESTGGYELVNKIKKQAENFGADFELQEINSLKIVGNDFVLSGFGKQYKSRGVILAFGKTPRDLNVVGEEELKGKGISYCATCDAPLYKNKIVTVAGYGDLGLEAALLCSKYAKKVYTLSKTDKLIGHPALLKKVIRSKKIELVPDVQIQEIFGESVLKGLKMIHLKTGQQIKHLTDGLFVEIGYIIQSGWLKGVVELDGDGQVVIDSDQSTSVNGIFAAGDVTNRPYKQAAISAGEGAAAGLAVYDWIMKQQGGVGMTSDWTQIKKIK